MFMIMKGLLAKRVAPTAIAVKKACLQCVEALDGSRMLASDFHASIHHFMSQGGRSVLPPHS